MEDDKSYEAMTLELMHSLFSSKPFTGFMKLYGPMMSAAQRTFPAPFHGKPLDQVLVTLAALQLASSGVSDDTLVEELFRGDSELDLPTMLKRAIEEKKIFEMEFDKDGLPLKYRLHTNGVFEYRREDATYLFESGMEKGTFIPYGVIAQWLRQNK